MDFDFFGDGSIVCIHTPGHTPGHQSAVVSVEGRVQDIIFCGDACYLISQKIFTLLRELDMECEGLVPNTRKTQFDEGQECDLWLGHEMEDWKRHLDANRLNQK